MPAPNERPQRSRKANLRAQRRQNPQPSITSGRLLIIAVIDERKTGLRKESRAGAEELWLLSAVLPGGYERGKVPVSGHLAFSDSEHIFKSSVSTPAAIDRLPHQGETQKEELPTQGLGAVSNACRIRQVRVSAEITVSRPVHQRRYGLSGRGHPGAECPMPRPCRRGPARSSSAITPPANSSVCREPENDRCAWRFAFSDAAW